MEKSYVSLEKKICAICGNEFETNAILMDRRLKNSMEHYTVTGMGHCKDCQAKIDDNYIAFVEVNNILSHGDTLKNENANRTGQIVWVKKHVVDEIFSTKTTTPMVFTEPDVIKYLTNLLDW